jgi:iron uptake system component EfeO
MNEQKEKVTKAATSEEESRYSQRTMADLRDNLDGTTTIYAIFQPWIVTKGNASDPAKDGKQIDGKITAGFKALAASYAQVSGDAIPAPPPTWSAENPSPTDLQTPFGKLYVQVRTSVDPNTDSGIVFEMNHAAAILGFPQFQQR